MIKNKNIDYVIIFLDKNYGKCRIYISDFNYKVMKLFNSI